MCPFHLEKTPSFSVTPDKRLYHRFGYGAGGDAIAFRRDIKKMSFPIRPCESWLGARGGPPQAPVSNYGGEKRVGASKTKRLAI
ncbi:MAG: hypothetical protein LBI10_04220 [Deltaproteobacteria bacterium]|nr:hypothetical protein [Deltaproteobacteria bacterium]